MPQLLDAQVPHGLARSFVSAPTSLLQLWMATDASTARDHAVYAGRPMERLVAELDGGTSFTPHTWLHALSYRSMLRGLGMLTAERGDTVDRAMLEAGRRSRRDLPPSWRATGAWMCIALDVPEQLPDWDGGGALKPSSQMSELPRRELLCLARRYAEAKLASGDLAATKPRWDWVLGVFLDEIECGSAEWDALWWAALCWLVDVEGTPNDALGTPFSEWVEALV